MQSAQFFYGGFFPVSIEGWEIEKINNDKSVYSDWFSKIILRIRKFTKARKNLFVV
jgi:hypothetical protein